MRRITQNKPLIFDINYVYNPNQMLIDSQAERKLNDHGYFKPNSCP